MKYARHILSFAIASGATALPFVALAANELQNPLSVSSISEFIALSLRVMVQVALPIISLFIVYSGFLFVSAQGNEEQLVKAKKNLLYVIIGAILILGAWVIATLIGGTVSQVLRG
jgi:heme/copper-type cytochrome/quinol oxidase subunit 4